MNSPKYAPEEPICAIATALAPAALGIVRCSGKNCIELVSKVFSRPKALLEAQGNSLVYGWITSENQKIDEVMVSVYRCPKSFTGEDMIEISCHGGPSVVTAIHSLLLNRGFRQAERGEFTFRAYINGKADLTKAEAVREIIDSHTGESRSRAAGRLAGNLFEEINSIKKLIIDTLAAIEVEIEYPEDEETIADSFDKTDLEKAIQRLEQLSLSWKGEKLYQDGARVVLCGRTNAGKSSLFNGILKEERAIVSDIEGTTRDWIESWVDFDGLPVRLFDTAGLRETEDVIEEPVNIVESVIKEMPVLTDAVDDAEPVVITEAAVEIEDIADDSTPEIPMEKTLEQLLESMTPLREDVVSHEEPVVDTSDDIVDVLPPDDTDATLAQLASEFVQNEDKIPSAPKAETSGKIGKLKNILPFKKAKRDDSGLMGDLFGWAGIAANDEDFAIPGFFTQAASKK